MIYGSLMRSIEIGLVWSLSLFSILSLIYVGCIEQLLQLEEKSAEDTTKEYQNLCRLKGLIVKDVHELNDLGETKLMAAAAEGKLVQSLLPRFCVNFPILKKMS